MEEANLRGFELAPGQWVTQTSRLLSGWGRLTHTPASLAGPCRRGLARAQEREGWALQRWEHLLSPALEGGGITWTAASLTLLSSGSGMRMDLPREG